MTGEKEDIFKVTPAKLTELQARLIPPLVETITRIAHEKKYSLNAQLVVDALLTPETYTKTYVCAERYLSDDGTFMNEIQQARAGLLVTVLTSEPGLEILLAATNNPRYRWEAEGTNSDDKVIGRILNEIVEAMEKENRDGCMIDLAVSSQGKKPESLVQGWSDGQLLGKAIVIAMRDRTSGGFNTNNYIVTKTLGDKYPGIKDQLTIVNNTAREQQIS